MLPQSQHQTDKVQKQIELQMTQLHLLHTEVKKLPEKLQMLLLMQEILRNMNLLLQPGRIIKLSQEKLKPKEISTSKTRELSLFINNGNSIWTLTELHQDKERKVITGPGSSTLKAETMQFFRLNKLSMLRHYSILQCKRRWIVMLLKEKHLSKLNKIELLHLHWLPIGKKLLHGMPGMMPSMPNSKLNTRVSKQPDYQLQISELKLLLILILLKIGLPTCQSTLSPTAKPLQTSFKINSSSQLLEEVPQIQQRNLLIK